MTELWSQKNFKDEEELLSPPKKIKQDKVTRAKVTEVISNTFVIKKKEFQQQFSKLYYVRLHQMKPKVQKSALTHFPNVRILDKIQDLKANIECIIIGTLFKEMKLRPNMIADFEADIEITTQEVPRSNFVSDDDFLILEDDTGRVSLKISNPAIQVGRFVTGIVCGVVGKLVEGGIFVVADVVLAEAPVQDILVLAKTDTFVAFISGIDLGNPMKSPFTLNLAFEYINGLLSASEEEGMIGNISNLIIVGNSLHPARDQDNRKMDVRGSLKATKLETIEKELVTLDSFIHMTGKTMSVHVMPGENDPTNPSVPQHAFHHSFFPQSSKMSTVKMVSNPHSFQVNGITMLGVSGQTIDDIRRYSNQTDSIEIMQDTLRYSHLSPTSPDSLDTYPFIESDPFVLDKSPHVYFVGCQDKFQTSLYEAKKCKIRLISLPRFIDTNTIVLLNLRTLMCHPVKFQE